MVDANILSRRATRDHMERRVTEPGILALDFLIERLVRRERQGCRAGHDISVIAGACPMMYGAGVDLGHTCIRWFMKLTGGLPAWRRHIAWILILIVDVGGLVMIWGALAVTAPFGPARRTVPSTA